MSKDRVKFTLGFNTASGHSAVRSAFEKAFGRAMPFVHPCSEITVICRPSQFARFLIYRDQEGGKNGFKELRAELIPAEETQIFDVSRNSTC